MIKLFEIVILWVYYTIPLCFSLFWHVWDLSFQLLKLLLWQRTTDEGLVPEMRIWSILLIKSDLKWCIHLSRSLFYMVCGNSKSCVFVDCRKWSYTLSYKNCHLTLLCLPHHFGILLAIFEKFQYFFDFDKLAITLQTSRMKNFINVLSPSKSIAYFSYFGMRNLKAAEGLFMFFFHTNI